LLPKSVGPSQTGRLHPEIASPRLEILRQYSG
jgi:hypothetical protein